MDGGNDPMRKGAARDSALIRHLERIFAAQSVAEAWALHCERMAGYGFDRLLYSVARLPSAVGVLEDTLFLSNHAPEFLGPFLREGWWARVVFLAHAEATGQSAVPWRVTPQMRLSDAQRRILAFRASHGIVAGYTLSFDHISRHGRAGMGLCARAGLDQDAVDAIWARDGAEIAVCANALHLRVGTLPLDLPARTLTERQRQVLAWISDGKTVQDVAVLIGLSPATVEKHLRRAREALGVQTTTQAVLKAAFLNQIYRLPQQETSTP